MLPAETSKPCPTSQPAPAYYPNGNPHLSYNPPGARNTDSCVALGQAGEVTHNYACSGPAAGDIAFRWIHGSVCAATNRDPRIHVLAYNEDTYILRENPCIHWEAPFTYLMFGNEGALLIDTGATAEAEWYPLRKTMDAILRRWCSIRRRKSIPLTVVLTSGEHHSQNQGLQQFADRPETTLAPTDLAGMERFYKLSSWPEGIGQIDPRAGLPGPAVEQAAHFGIEGEVERDVDGVADIDEVAFLFAILEIGTMRLEEFNVAACFHLMIGLLHERTHVGLVIFIGTVDVEIFQADDFVEMPVLERPQIEHVFGVTVHVERYKFFGHRIVVIVTQGAVAIGGRARCVDKSRALRETPFAERAGVAVIIFEEIIGIALGRGTAGAEMDACRGAGRFAILDGFEELPGREHVFIQQAP